VFVALVLHARDILVPWLDDVSAGAYGQALLLSLCGLALFLHVSRDHPSPVAFGGGALFALHPVQFIFARHLTYYTLHMVGVTVATLVLARAVRSDADGRSRRAWILAAGSLWGAVTLVRAVSLVLPPFILLLALWHHGRGGWRAAVRFTATFTLAMAAIVVPYTVRNYRATGRVIAVNAQGGQALWGLALSENPRGDSAEWMHLWWTRGEGLFAEATGGLAYSVEALNAHTMAVDDRFRRDALENMRRHPARFVRNVASNALAFNIDYTHRWLERLAKLRDGRHGLARVAAAQVLGWSILLFALAGMVRGLRDGDTDARVLAAVYCMFWAAHCLTILMTRYTYVRFPLVLIALPLGLRRFEAHPAAPRTLLVAVAVAALLAAEGATQ
jgi:hypothetical protein